MVRFNCRALSGLWLALLLAACAGMSGNPTATMDYDHSYNFSPIHKIAIQPIAKATLSTMMMSDEQIGRINQALHAELLRRGFEVVTVNADADIFLSWKFLPPESDEVSTFDPATDKISGGTLYVSMIDPLSLQAVWRATFHSRLSAQQESAEADQYRQQAAQAILAQFPPNPA
jgi:hypothetical protein